MKLLCRIFGHRWRQSTRMVSMLAFGEHGGVVIDPYQKTPRPVLECRRCKVWNYV